MNNRPIVLPGIVTGVVLLAAMTGFSKLPAEENAAAATGGSAKADISMCRSTQVNLDAADLKSSLDKADAQGTLNTLGNVLNSLQQNVTSPDLSNKVQDPMANFFAVGVRTYNGIASTQKITVVEVDQLKAAYEAMNKACDAIGA